MSPMAKSFVPPSFAEWQAPALRALHARGAHFVLCRPDKRAIATGWQKAPPDLDAVTRHAKSGSLVGVIPWSLGCAVIDVDEGGETGMAAVMAALGGPVTWTPTKRQGGFHIWYRAATAQGNRKWQIGEAAGDVRGAKGYVILWDAKKIAAALADLYDDADEVDTSRLPSPPRKTSGCAAVRRAKDGERNEVLNSEAFKAAKRGDLDSAAYREAGIASGLNPAEVDATIASAERGGKAAAEARARIQKNSGGLALALKILGIGHRWNMRTQAHEFCPPASTSWQPLEDEERDAIRERLYASFDNTKGDPLNFGDVAWNRAWNALMAHSRVDPFKDWLNSLPPHDGTARLDHWLSEVFDLSVAELAAWAGRFVFLGAVQRTFEPGTKLDETPVLIGPQGCGKSTAVSYALPKSMRADYFSDGLRLSMDHMRRVEQILGSAIVEISEMSGLGRVEREDLKAFLTAQIDTGRLAYKKTAGRWPRTCTFVGTANGAALPNDPSGNRRFVVVEIQYGDPAALRTYLDENRVQLWAEALARFHGGEHSRLPEELFALRDAVNEHHRRGDEILEDKVAAWIRGRDGERFTSGAAAAGVGLVSGGEGAKLSKQDSARLRDAILHCGGEQKPGWYKGENQRWWVVENSAIHEGVAPSVTQRDAKTIKDTFGRPNGILRESASRCVTETDAPTNVVQLKMSARAGKPTVAFDLMAIPPNADDCEREAIQTIDGQEPAD